MLLPPIISSFCWGNGPGCFTRQSWMALAGGKGFILKHLYGLGGASIAGGKDNFFMSGDT